MTVSIDGAMGLGAVAAVFIIDRNQLELIFILFIICETKIP